MGKREKNGLGGWSTHQKTQKMSPRKLPCRKGKIGAGSVLWILKGGGVGGGSGIFLQICSLLSTSFPPPPPANPRPTVGTKDVVLVSCHSATGSLIKQTSRCHRSLGRVRSATAWLPPQTPAPGAPDLITQEPLRLQPWRKSRARLRFPTTERAGGAPASLSAGAPQPDAR